jgi:hypothetical protein
MDKRHIKLMKCNVSEMFPAFGICIRAIHSKKALIEPSQARVMENKLKNSKDEHRNKRQLD